MIWPIVMASLMGLWQGMKPACESGFNIPSARFLRSNLLLPDNLGGLLFMEIPYHLQRIQILFGGISNSSTTSLSWRFAAIVSAAK